MLFNKIAIIGVGLIGGSLARALKAKDQCNIISGFGRNQDNLQKAVDLGVIDDYSDDINTVVQDAEVIVFATPLFTFRPLLELLLPCINDDVIITDAGSEKGSVVKAAREVLGKNITNFIPGHPIAGTEKSGVEASFKELYQDHLVILTPLPENSDQNISIITQMWETCGANVVNLEVDYHDKVLAATSHLPHVLAYALIDCLANMEEQGDVFKFSAGGFRDFTRIAASNSEMWADICLSNKTNLLELLNLYTNHLTKIKKLIDSDERAELIELFSRVKTTREKLNYN